MKHKGIRYIPKALVVFSVRELEIMLKTSQHHYDGVCKDASAERLSHQGNRPGFLRALHNCRRNVGRDCVHDLTFRELDTLAKILEMAHLSFSKEADLSRIASLRLALSAALRSLNDNTLPDKDV